MVGIESSDDRHAFLTPHTRVEFLWRDDRWVHAITPAGRCDGLPRVETVEGDPERDDPMRVVSPAYQQAHIETGPDGITRMLLVGQSGPHHFSAAFAITADDGGTTVDVDVADRCRTPIASLAATYQLAHSPAELSGMGTDEIRFDLPGKRLALSSGTSPDLAASPSPGALLHAMVMAPVSPDSHTQRFRYQWRCSAG